MNSQIKTEDQKIRDSAKNVLNVLAEWGVDVVAKSTKKVVLAKNEVAKDIVKTPKVPLPKAPAGSKQAALDLILNEIGDCKRCALCKERTNIVFGVGNPNAQLMFVGEAPGADEDEQGIPFVGRAGQLLTKMIEAMGINRDDVYIANIAKCRPPDNRPPEPIEISTCSPYLKQQIEVIKPKIIVCLGKFASQTLLQTEIPITKLRGEFHEYMGIKFMPTYHPAYLLRNPPMKKFVWEDLKKVMNFLGMPIKEVAQ